MPQNPHALISRFSSSVTLAMSDIYKQYKVLFQEVINCSLRDYQTGAMTEEELDEWLNDESTMQLYSDCLQVSSTELKDYLEDQIDTIEKGQYGKQLTK